MTRLRGKVALITGAGSGMAKASTKVFVREGARVVAAREADVAEACRTAVAEFGHLDIVLNVAGIGGPQPLHELDMDAYDRTFDVNLRGVLLGMKYGIRTMLAGRHGGAIVNWSSVGGLGASTFGTSVDAASKAGVTSATKSAAVEYGDRGIRVNAIWPGFILTEIMGAAGAEHGGWSARLA